MMSISCTESYTQASPSHFASTSTLAGASKQELSTLDDMHFQIGLKEKKLEALLTEYEQLVLQSQIDSQEAKIAEMMRNVNHYEKLAYQHSYELSSLQYVLERTKKNTDSLKAKVKSLQRYRDKAELLYRETSETSIEATKLFNIEHVKAQQYKTFIEETRDFKLKELSGKLSEVRDITNSKAKDTNNSISDVEGALAKLRTQDIQKRISYFEKQKEKTSLMAQELKQKRMIERFRLFKFYRVMGSFDLDSCIKVYNDTIFKNSSLSIRTDELLKHINKLIEVQKTLRNDMQIFKEETHEISQRESQITDSKIDILYSDKHSQINKKKLHMHAWESKLKAAEDMTIKLFMVISSILQKIDKADKLQLLGPATNIALGIDSSESGEELKCEPDIIIQCFLLAEKKLFSACTILYEVLSSRNLGVGMLVRQHNGFIYFIKHMRKAARKATFLEAYNADISAKNVEIIKKQIYNTHFLDIENNVPQISEMITGAAHITESSRKVFEKQGRKKSQEIPVDFDVLVDDDESLRRNSQLAMITEQTEIDRQDRNNSRRRSKDRLFLSPSPISFTPNISIKSKSARNLLQTLPNLPKIHKTVKSLTTKTNRAKKEPEIMTFKSIFEDISVKKQDLLKTVDKVNSPSESTLKLPALTSPKLSEAKAGYSKFSLKTSRSQEFFKHYK